MHIVMLNESRKEELLKQAEALLEKEGGGAAVGLAKGMKHVVGDTFINAVKGFGKHVMGRGTATVRGAKLTQSQATKRLIGTGRTGGSRPAGPAVRKGSAGHGPATSGHTGPGGMGPRTAPGARSAVRDKAHREELKKGVAALRAKKYLARGALAAGGYTVLRGGASGADAYDKATYRHYRG